MQRVIVCIICAISLIAAEAADARGLGRFVGGLLARGAVSATVHGTRKSYTPDVLTVDQLVQCLKKASALDQQSEDIESKRREVQIVESQIDRLKNQMDMNERSLNRYSQAAIDSFNADVNRYNTAVINTRANQNVFNEFVNVHNGNVDSYNLVCAKKYYADDMENARRLAGF